MTQNDDRINSLFDELVPASGKAESLAGEIIRATARIGYRYYNDGDMIGTGYGKETCNPAARFLLDKLPMELTGFICKMWEEDDEARYEVTLEEFIGSIADYIESHPELRFEPTEDMWDFRNSEEDIDDTENEEEYYC